VEFVLGAAGTHQFPEPLGWEAAFMGRSNSGKSSMLNRLLGRKAMARVSAEPGRTREINFFRVLWRRGTEPFYVADFPGYGFARAPKDKVRGWASLAGGYLAGRRGQKSFLLVDIRRSLGEDEFMLLDLFRKLGTPVVLVATKCDKLTRNGKAAKLAEWRSALPGDVPLLPFSALTGEGREELILEAMPRPPLSDTVLEAEGSGVPVSRTPPPSDPGCTALPSEGLGEPASAESSEDEGGETADAAGRESSEAEGGEAADAAGRENSEAEGGEAADASGRESSEAEGGAAGGPADALSGDAGDLPEAPAGDSVDPAGNGGGS
jgi:GTP-binding protein